MGFAVVTKKHNFRSVRFVCKQPDCRFRSADTETKPESLHLHKLNDQQLTEVKTVIQKSVYFPPTPYRLYEVLPVDYKAIEKTRSNSVGSLDQMETKKDQ